MADVFGMALRDYQNGHYTEDIKTYSSLDETDVIPVPYLFREFDEMPKIEQKALQLARGKILDIGAGAGNHALYLQKKDLMSPPWTIPKDALLFVKKEASIRQS